MNVLYKDFFTRMYAGFLVAALFFAPIISDDFVIQHFITACITLSMISFALPDRNNVYLINRILALLIAGQLYYLFHDIGFAIDHYRVNDFVSSTDKRIAQHTFMTLTCNVHNVLLYFIGWAVHRYRTKIANDIQIPTT